MNPAKSAPSEFVISRTLDAPREVVWKAWTDPEALARWWGPVGFEIHVTRLDLRPEGIFHYRMRPTEGSDMWGKFTFLEIVPPERLVYYNSFSDPEGRTTRAPFAETFPLRVLSTVTFEARGEQTVLTIHGTPFEATDAERAMFEGMFGSMNQGWGGTLDELEAYLAEARK
jgi:uncharacterized protein YndB with AHSA1/START domain